jgi:hypothetical protein
VSGSLTVIGGHSSTQGLTGLVTIPAGFTGPVVTSLQSLLSAASGPVSTGSANFENLNVAGQTGAKAATVGGFATGILEITNTSSVGATTAGSTGISLAVPAGYNTLVIQAPGSETISGNGANNLLAVFGAQSTVNFNPEGGSGTIFAGGAGDFVNASGISWSVSGAAAGNDTIAVAVSDAAYIGTSGQGNAVNNAIGAVSTPSNVVGMETGDVSVNSDGTNDLIESYGGNDVVSVGNSANVLDSGAADTVYAMAGSTAVKAFFQIGGTLDFINLSSQAATVSGDVPGATGGGDTVFGGTGGGVYYGGSGGNNSLLGGTGAATLIAAGANNFLSVGGAGSTAAYNLLNAGDGGATLVAGSSTKVNQFYGGTRTDSIVSNGSGTQVYFIGSQGTENIIGTTVSGAANDYYFGTAAGAREDAIYNFSLSRDSLTVTGAGDTISGVYASGSNSLITLSDGTVIQLYGISASSISSLAGGSHI